MGTHFLSIENFGVKWLYRSRRKERRCLQGMAEVWVTGEVAEVSLAWEGAGCPTCTQNWGRHSCPERVQCIYTGELTQLSLDSWPRFPEAWISIVRIFYPLCCAGSNQELLEPWQWIHCANHAIGQPRRVPNPLPPQSFAWNFAWKVCALNSKFPIRFLPLADGRSCTLSRIPAAASNPAGCTPAPPPAPTCVCRRRGWHQAC